MNHSLLPYWLHELEGTVTESQHAAWQHLISNGLPNKKSERWRYANLKFFFENKFIIRKKHELSEEEKQFVLSRRRENFYLIVFAHGHWYVDFPNNDFSDAAQMTRIDVNGLSVEVQEALPLMHGLLCDEMISLSIIEEKKCQFQCIYLSKYDLHCYTPHLILNLRKSSQCIFLEENYCEGEPLFLNRLQANLAEKSHCEYIQRNALAPYYRWQYNEVFQKSGSQWHSSQWTRDMIFMRDELKIELQEEQARCYTSGFYQLNQNAAYVDHHVDILHQASHTESEMLFKGIVETPSRAVFNGRLWVAPDIKQIQAYQGNHHLLLDSRGEVRSKPELEIYSNEVACKHGSTTGALDEDALFYLQARGIPLESARKLLMQGFSQDILDRISLEPISEEMKRVFYDKE